MIEKEKTHAGQREQHEQPIVPSGPLAEEPGTDHRDINRRGVLKKNCVGRGSEFCGDDKKKDGCRIGDRPRDNAPGNFAENPGIARLITTAAITLRPPAIATGFKSIDLMRTPPSDQRMAAASRSRTCLFNEKSRSFRVAGVQEHPTGKA